MVSRNRPQNLAMVKIFNVECNSINRDTIIVILPYLYCSHRQFGCYDCQALTMTHHLYPSLHGN